MEMEIKQKTYKRNFEKFDENEFKKDIKKLNMETKIKSLKGVNFKYKFFHDSAMTVIDKHVPFKELSNKEIKDMKKPWVTKGIKVAIKKKTNF